MSLTFESGRPILLTFLFLLFTGSLTAAPSHVKIEIVTGGAPRVKVEGRSQGASTVWAFTDVYGPVVGLSRRVEKLTFKDEAGAEVPFKQGVPGEFVSSRPASVFAYEVNLTPPSFATDAAHVSWLADDLALLMLGDLLPQARAGTRVSLVLPTGWSSIASEEKTGPAEYRVSDVERAMFIVGRGLRVRSGRAGPMQYEQVVTGDWAFSDEELFSQVGDALKDYSKLFGGVPGRRAVVLLAPFPRPVGGNAWSAETRGQTAVILSGKLPSKNAALAQLNNALLHELFHLWVPNGLSLEGDYGWFYEGFTNYQSVRAGLRLNQLTFRDYLNALGRSYDAYLSARGQKEVSLLEASRRRWSGARTLVYAKGMLVAFLYDLTLLQKTGGRLSLDDVYKELFRRHAGAEKRVDGATAVAEVLGGMPGMREFVEHHLRGADAIKLPDVIESFGLRVEPGGVRTHVSVAPSLSRNQTDVLRKLGYNEKLDGRGRRNPRALRNP